MESAIRIDSISSILTVSTDNFAFAAKTSKLAVTMIQDLVDPEAAGTLDISIDFVAEPINFDMDAF